jgi:hypothetical protein
MFDRELTQLISTAKHYLDAAQSIPVSDHDLARAVSADSLGWPADRLPHPLSLLDSRSAHLASCATRLATVHEILVGGTDKAWAIAYPKNAAITDDNLKLATAEAIEILLRDNVAHAEDPTTNGVKRSKFRKAALSRLTFKELQSHLQLRYRALAEKMREPTNA